MHSLAAKYLGLRIYVQLYVTGAPLSAVLRRLCDEFEEIAQKALTTPANTKELMELKAYVEKVESETLYALEKKLIHAKKKLVFLIEYSDFSSAEMRFNAHTFTWLDRMPSVIAEHRDIIAEKQNQYQKGLKVHLNILCRCFLACMVHFASVEPKL